MLTIQYKYSMYLKMLYILTQIIELVGKNFKKSLINIIQIQTTYEKLTVMKSEMEDIAMIQSEILELKI